MAKEPIPRSAPLNFVSSEQKDFQALIAIPCCNEFKNLEDVLESLENNKKSLVETTLIVINVNNRIDMDNGDNLKTINLLKNYQGPLNLAFINSSKEPYSYPAKFGVGLARHQAVMAGIDHIQQNSPVISLDGDSPVNEEYLKSIFDYMEQFPTFGAGHANFKHRHEGTGGEIEAIQLYDRHLHMHREGLEKAGSPHAWYAIGSTIICTKEAYLKSGGYNSRRMAGEDFYLLQQLSKVGYKIEMIHDAFVYPSNRQSDRVPFGTGKAVIDILEAGEWHTYNPECYKILKGLLQAVYSNTESNADFILQNAPKESIEWLESRSFSSIWEKLQQNSKSSQAMIQRFNEWMDAFQTLKLIHFLTDNYFPKIKIVL